MKTNARDALNKLAPPQIRRAELIKCMYDNLPPYDPEKLRKYVVKRMSNRPKGK